MSYFHRFYSRGYLPTISVAGVAASAIAAQKTNALLCSEDRSEDCNANDCNSPQFCSSNRHRVQQDAGSFHRLTSDANKILASSPAGNSSRRTFTNDAPNKMNTIECDYAIIGHGRAGRSAVRTLKALDPSASIVIIDPNNVQSNQEQTKRRRLGAVQHLPTRATSIDHSGKIVRVSHNPSSGLQASIVHYRKSILLATGSRGAPPPNECIGPDAKSRILELRSTSVPIFDSNDTNHKKTQQLPILDPDTVRSLSLMAASQGATVAVMGSGFEALELAASLARASPKSNDDDSLKVQLLFGSSGPLSSRLPRYLSVAISKRLRQCGIDVEERSMTRYLSMENSSEIPRLEIYTVKSYDRLDSRRLITDLLVLAPGVGGMSGTAVLPTTNESVNYTSNNYLPWSSLVTPSLVTCYLEDGRVSTNAELLAASSIYAAGSVAKCPNSRTGQADVAGGDYMSADLSGEIAARNMANESLSNRKEKQEFLASNSVQEAIPVWRSDEVPYLSNNSTQQASTLALYSMGIHALCVGKCDSVSMATHGFWWTNTNNQGEIKKDVDNTTSEIKIRPNSFMRRMTRRVTNNSSKDFFTRGGSLPVYGSGVVYYLDQCGSIQGVMLWGLPFSKDSSNVRSSVNDEVIERMKDVIRTNGGVVVRDHSDKIAKESYGVTMDVDLLSFMHLSEESKHLASMALTGSTTSGGVERKIVLGRPLHRYTPWKPSEMSNLGKVRRKDDAGQTVGVNDLFYPSSNDVASNQWANEPIRPPSLKRIYTMQGEATWLANAEAMQLQQERSRPAKEEPLWLRKTEEYRYVNKKDSMSQDFITNMLSGQFSDGSDAIKQAPVPRFYLNTKERIRSWVDDELDENEVDEAG